MQAPEPDFFHPVSQMHVEPSTTEGEPCPHRLILHSHVRLPGVHPVAGVAHHVSQLQVPASVSQLWWLLQKGKHGETSQYLPAVPWTHSQAAVAVV